MIRAVVVALALFLSATPALAAPPTLEGPAVQGGLLQGHVAPGSLVWQDGRKIRVAPDGRFLVAFAYNAAPSVELKIKPPEGEAQTTELKVAARTFEVQRIEGLPPEQVTPDEKTLQRIAAEHEEVVKVQTARTETPLFTHSFRWPAFGILSGLYGSARVLNGQPRAPHLGVDVTAPEGTPIVAPTDGVVVLIADQFLTGNTVMIDHGLGLTSVYAHLSRVDVAPGEQVKAGTQIGLMGKTGRATGPNLHWGVHLNGVAVDPELLAGPMPPAAPAPSGAGGE